ncbi:MAG TPA: glycosyltransferase [Thermoanaerobaculia bacterium]|nr:glycosyltransferase [Thermoanaerobaculia bacterium]
MPSFLLALAAVTLLGHLAAAVAIWRGNRSIRSLADQPPLAGPLPRVSIVIPARNEERNLEEALQSILALDYDNLEIDVVDDRSTDSTGEILDRMARANPRLRVVHVRELPPGWLGKNHALELGGRKATGDYLLFTDADVVIEPTALRRAVAAMAADGLDHLTATPEIDRPSVLFEMFIGVFSLFFTLFVKPWKVRDPKSPNHVGIGAFNLVRASAWRAVGGHQRLAMRPDDDLKLGKLLKTSGFRQEMMFGRGMLRVEWYRSVGELIQGLMKNAFPGVDYRLSVVLSSTVIQLTILVWPFLAVLVTSGAARWLNLASVAVLLGLCWLNAPLAAVRRWHGVGFPVVTLLFLYILWRSTLTILWRGGIDWRGTHYPLADLKANKL